AAVTRSASHVTATLMDGVLHYEVDETFVNHGGRIGEADYVFPLPHDAAFSDLKLSINGELVGGETMDAQHARSIYEEIVRRQRDPALVEWMGYGMLRTRIFPILPGESKRVVVRFDQIAEREGDALRIDYTMGAPLGRAPIVRNVLVDDSDDSAASTFTLRYAENRNYGKPYSPTHELRSVSRDGMNVVSARGDARALTLLLPAAHGNGSPTITLLANDDGRQDGFALINVVPPTVSTDVTPRDITFVLDVSGSMAGSKMEQARAAGRQLLSSLNPRDRFRLIDFSTDVRSFRDGFTQATPSNVRAALSYLASLSAQGSTNISGALSEALRHGDDQHAERLQVVLFLTDGQPTIGETSADAIAAEAAQLRGSARVFTFGLGGDVNASLLEQLALQGRGTAQFVRPSEDVERAVAVVSQRLTNPIATNVRVSADGVRLSRILPGSPIDVFAGQNIVILARYAGDGSATLHFDGDSPRGAVHWTQRVTFPRDRRDNQFVGRLWATQRIGYLSAERRRVGGNPELDNEIRSLGEQFGIPTEFTSYLVQEPRPTGMPVIMMRGAASMGTALNQVIVSGAAASAPSAFEVARKATAQRAATTLAAADAATDSTAGGVVDGAIRHVGDRSFIFANGIWADTRASAVQRDSSVTRLRVQAFSAAYFRVLDIVPSIKPMLALGDHVIVAGRGIVLEVGPQGVTNLGARDVASLRAGW
ncbi:MAG TPA: VWA domain-containing protein, partial [Gemmatimonadaceae bacterium]|nr:VWA domain-containing protein [Gemmatimonadaceae bacterium]